MNVTLTATGDDRACGSGTSYQVRAWPDDVLDPDWLTATPLGTFPVGAASGEADAITVPGVPAGTMLLVRAFDDAGNGSAVSSLPEPSRVAGLAAASLLLLALARHRR